MSLMWEKGKLGIDNCHVISVHYIQIYIFYKFINAKKRKNR